MGKESRRRKGVQIDEFVLWSERQAGRARDPGPELAESFRRASKALEAATRDIVALRRRVTKPPSR
jgi:hypothetical protein